MPQPQNIQELAAILETSVDDLRRLAGAAHRLYRCRAEPKPSGGHRLIEAPFDGLKAVQRRLVDQILDKLPESPLLFGRKGKSQIDAAKLHVGQPMLVTMDLQNFFPSVKVTHVRAALKGRGFDPESAEVICRLCTRKRRLPQGAPTSPALARIVIAPILASVETAAKGASENVRVTQYVDDLAISGPEGIKRLIPLIRRIFLREGFQVHPRKTHVMKEGPQQELLGIKLFPRLDVCDNFKKKLADAHATLPKGSPSLGGLEAWRRQVRRAG